LLIAAGGPQAATFAGREGDGIIVTSGKGAELYRDTLLPALEKGAREASKDPAQLERMIEMKVSFDHDRGRALEDTTECAERTVPGAPRERAGRAPCDGGPVRASARGADRVRLRTSLCLHADRRETEVGRGLARPSPHQEHRDERPRERARRRLRRGLVQVRVGA